MFIFYFFKKISLHFLWVLTLIYTYIHTHQIPRERGILKIIDSGNPLTEKIIVKRIIDHRLKYEERNRKKELKKLEEEKEKARLAAAAASGSGSSN